MEAVEAVEAVVKAAEASVALEPKAGLQAGCP